MKKLIFSFTVLFLLISCEKPGEKPVLKERYQIRFENVSEGSEIMIRGLDGTIIKKTVRSGEFTYEADLKSRNIISGFLQ